MLTYAGSLAPSRCVPVIVTDDIQLPFQNAIDYRALSIKVAHADVFRLPELLRQVTDDRLRKKQQALCKWWKAMTYQSPPAPGDAFNYMLQELQTRVNATLSGTPMGTWL
jgi:hypothetical protein